MKQTRLIIVLILVLLLVAFILTKSEHAKPSVAEAVTVEDLPPSREQVIDSLRSVVSVENIDEFISIKTEEYGVTNEKKFRDVIACESQYRHDMDPKLLMASINAKNQKSSASGIMQVTDATHIDFAKYLKQKTGRIMERMNPYDQIESSLIAISIEKTWGGWQRWIDCL